MKILVTGGAGFIGSHTVVELLNNNFDVVVVDNFCNSKPYVLDRIKEITGKNFAFYRADITDSKSMEEIFQKESIDAIIHFAALKSNADSIANPSLYCFNNIYSSLVIVSLMEKYQVKKIVFSSSATVYGNNENVPIKETEIIGNVISPYGFSKYINELYLKDRSENAKTFKAIALRYFNPIGAHPSGLLGEDSPDNIPNNLMLYVNKVAKKELPYLNIFGDDYRTSDGSGIRDYIHVCDVARGHIAALNHLEKMENSFEAFNLGTGRGHTVLELVNLFKKVNEVKVPTKISGRRPGDVEISFASVSKAKKEMSWESVYSFEEALKDSYNFERNKKKDT